MLIAGFENFALQGFNLNCKRGLKKRIRFTKFIIYTINN